MRVLVCIPCLLVGGTEVQTLSLVRALIKAGHTVNVVCYFENLPEMVERYVAAGAVVTVLSKNGLRPNGIRTTTMHLWRGLRIVVKNFQPDVAHVQYMTPGALPILILKTIGVKKILATSHTDASIYSQTGLSIIRFLKNHVLTGFQCITQAAEKGYFGESKMFDKNIRLGHCSHFTIYNTLPEGYDILKSDKKFDDKKITVGVVSRLEKIKGMDLVIHAFVKAVEKVSNLELLVVGDGSLSGMMKQHALASKYADKIRFVGRKNQDELQEYYDQIDILLMPSRSEGFGLTAIEGMARGCVPVVANVGGLPEVVDHNMNLIHETESIDSIAKKIVTLSNNREKLAQLSKGAADRATVFSFDKFENQIKSLYNQI